MMNKICSIIIPIYNCAETIINSLDSLQLHKLDRFEIIIIDDGSEDSSAELVRGYIKPYDNCMLFSILHKGVSSARNYGIKKATGKYIFFMDSDDAINRENFENALNLCIENDLDLAVFDYDIIEYGGKSKISVCNLEHNVILGQKHIQKELLKSIFISKSTGLVNLWNKIYKKGIIDNFNIIFDEKSIYGEDLVFNILYIQKCKKIMAFSERFYKYYCHSSSDFPSYKKKDYSYDLLKVHNTLFEVNKKYLKFSEESEFFLQYKLNFYNSIIAYLQNKYINAKNKKIFLRKNEIKQSIRIVKKYYYKQFSKKSRLILILLEQGLVYFALFVLSKFK